MSGRHNPPVCAVLFVFLLSTILDGGHSGTVNARISERANLQFGEDSTAALRKGKLMRQQVSARPHYRVQAQHATPVKLAEFSHAECLDPPDLLSSLLSAEECSLHMAPVFVEQIDAQLRPFAGKTLSSELLDVDIPIGTRNSAHDFIHITIHDGNISFYPLQDPWQPSEIAKNRLYGLLGLLNVYMLSFQSELPKVDFVYNLGDWPVVPDSDARPIFSMTHLRRGEVDNWSGIDAGRGHLDILFPAPMFCYWQEESNNMSLLGNVSWQDKDDVLFWRGSNTGHGHRHALVSNGAGIDKADMYFSACCCEDHNETCPDYLRSWVQMEDQASHKYLVDVDGYSFSTRFKNLLLSNSLVFKQASPYKEWYYDIFRPGVHYIQLERDLSDLSEKVRWAREHDSDVRDMTELAAQAVADHVTFGDALCYIHQLLTKYQKLFESS